jgi:hypothetical protein
VVYALGRVNFLSDPSQTPHLATEQLARLLGVKQATMAGKGRVVMDLLGLDHFDTEFCLPSRLASHPTAWWIAIDGQLYDARTLPIEIQAELARRGLIPASSSPRRRHRPTRSRHPRSPVRRTPLSVSDALLPGRGALGGHPIAAVAPKG